MTAAIGLPPPAPPALTPLVARHTAPVAAALRALLGLDADEPWTWRSGGRAGAALPSLVVTLGADDDRCELELSAPEDGLPAALRGRRVHLGHRRLGPAAAARWDGAAAAVAAADAVPGAPALEALWAARRAAAAWLGVEDADFRALSEGEALLRLGFRCNQDCSFCFQSRRWPDPDLGTLRTWLTELVGAGARRVILSGGEPTVYLDTLLTLARQARRELGVADVWIQTNAIRLGQPEVLAALSEAGVAGALVSYHSADAAISDAMTRAPGTHARSERGVVAALQAGWRVDLNVVVEARTLAGLVTRSDRILELFAPAARAGGATLSSAFSYPSDYEAPGLFARSARPLDEVAPALVAAMRRLRQGGVAVAAVGSCGFPACALADAPELLAAVDLAAMDPAHARSRLQPPPCQACALRERCVGPRREYLDAFGDGALRPFAAAPAAVTWPASRAANH